MRIFTKIVFAVVATAFALGGHASEPAKAKTATADTAAPVQLDLDYRTAIQLALLKNFQIKVEEFTPLIAKARLFSASGRFDPTLEASYTYDQNRRDLRALDPNFDSGAPNSPGTDRFAETSGSELDTTITGLTPWGLRYDFGGAITRNTNTRSSNFEQYDTFVGGSINQPLLRNFGTDVNLAEIRRARADQAISSWSLQARVIDVITDTIFVYNDLYFSIRNLEVEKRSRELAAQLLNDNQKRAEIGVMSPLDVLQAQADVASREERVLVAERAVFDNQNFLKQLVTDEITTILRTRIDIAEPPFDFQVDVDLDRDLHRAFDLRPDYRQALLEIQKRNINVVFTKNQTLPRLDLVASLGLNGLGTTLGESINNVSGPSNIAASAGAIFSLPVPNRTARGEAQASELEVARALIDLKRLEQAIYIEADNAAGQIDTTRKRIEASRVAREFAERTLDAAQARLASGTATTFEVLQFQRDFAQAEINEVRALTDHQKSIAEYARRTGRTMEANRILLQ
jgi:outer membrane protein TolC